jgi:hypothetical protein
MAFRSGIILAAMTGLLGCATANKPVNTADGAIAKAMVEISKEFPQVKPDANNFHAALRDGNWYVELNTEPGGFGGDIFIVISQRNGKILSAEMPD